MRLLTWNVWFGEHERVRRGRALVAEITRRRPDVVALQEVTAPLHRILEEELAG